VVAAPDHGGATAARATPTIGVLNLQGDVREHVAALGDVGVESRLVKRSTDLDGLAGLILPGGESTTLSMLLSSSGLFDVVAQRLNDGFPVLGTCAGLVLLARQVLDGRPDQRSFGALDVVVRRNGFGRQVASFETELELVEGPALPAVFIRAPYVVSVADDVDVLAKVKHRGQGLDGEALESPALVRQGNVLACCFHPELTSDRRIHRLFVEMCAVS
jgi:pyridoxal 5'-phosphate synthase pdxT subunit